uniref:Uncharacterized protein n=1 Tax=Ananas comosus var. bracteatus TaxID=296719 RepID=A0A6V7NP54_ANACO|nr:unnamed protein product [Ananas comosus var. bracteatus]
MLSRRSRRKQSQKWVFRQYLFVASTNAQTECTNAFGDLTIRDLWYKALHQNSKKGDLADSRIEFWRACTGTRLCLYRYKVDGCTGTAIGACTGTEPQSPATRASGLDFVDLVPVQGPVYRYKAADFAQFETAGVFLLL